MSNDIWTRDEPQSPCIKICAIHPEARICVGCLRSMDEIRDWGAMSATERQAVLDALPDRKSLIAKRRGGRKRR